MLALNNFCGELKLRRQKMARTSAGQEGGKRKIECRSQSFPYRKCFYSCFQGRCAEVLSLCRPYHNLGTWSRVNKTKEESFQTRDRCPLPPPNVPSPRLGLGTRVVSLTPPLTTSSSSQKRRRVPLLYQKPNHPTPESWGHL